MTATLKRRYQSPSSSSSESSAWVHYRPKRNLPQRHRKVARFNTSHCVVSIHPSLQQHRGRDVSFSSSSDTDVSSAETELGTALSENEIESVLPVGNSKSSSSEKSRSDLEVDLSSPCKEENEVDDDLGSVRMSSSPSPPPAGFASLSEKMHLGGPFSVKWKGKGVDGRDKGDVKRRKIFMEAELSEVEDEADDEMEDADDAEDMTVTPKQKIKRTRKILGLKVNHYPPSLAGTPSIQRITESFNGLTPYSMEMQVSPDRLGSAGQLHNLSDIYDPDEVDATLVASPSPRPSKKRAARSRFIQRRPCPEPPKQRLHSRRSGQSAAKKLDRARRAPYAMDPFCQPTMTVLRAFHHFDVPLHSEESPKASSTWSYGPLSSPIRLATDAPTSPIRSRIAGQRSHPNKNLQRRSPTSLVPSRHHQKGRVFRSRAHSHSRLALPLLGPTTLIGQHVVTLVLHLKAARVKRRNAVARQNAQIDYNALSDMRARCFESLTTIDAFKNTLEDIRRGCWWWAPAPVAATGRLRAVPTVEEIQVDCLVGNVAGEAAGDAEEVATLVSEAPEPVVCRSNRRRRMSTSCEDFERMRRAEAAQIRIREHTPVAPANTRQTEVAATQARRITSRTIVRRGQGTDWNNSSERAAAQRRSLGRRASPSAENAHVRPQQHVSALAPPWLEAVVIPPLLLAPTPVNVTVEEPEDTDTESDPESDSVSSEPPAYDSGTYPRHIPCPPHLRPRQPPSPVQVRLPSYAVNRYSRRSPSPPPPYNAETDRQTLVAPLFIGEDDDDEGEDGIMTVAVPLPEQRVVGAYPIAGATERVWEREDRGRSRFDAALEMEEGEDADAIDELTSAYPLTRAEGEATAGSVAGAIGGFLGRFFGRR